MKKRFLILAILLFSITTNPVFANDGSDPPTPGKAAQDSDGPPPPGLDVPIDSQISIGFLMGLIIGGSYVYKKSLR